MKISSLLVLLLGSAFAQSQDEKLSFSLERQGANSIVTLRSIKKFPCRNYVIDFRDYQNADTTILVIRDYIPPTNCSGVRDFAVEKYTITPTSKRFFLQLRYKGKRDMWRIFQQDTTYLVSTQKASFSSYVVLEK